MTNFKTSVANFFAFLFLFGAQSSVAQKDDVDVFEDVADAYHVYQSSRYKEDSVPIEANIDVASGIFRGEASPSTSERESRMSGPAKSSGSTTANTNTVDISDGHALCVEDTESIISLNEDIRLELSAIDTRYLENASIDNSFLSSERLSALDAAIEQGEFAPTEEVMNAETETGGDTTTDTGVDSEEDSGCDNGCWELDNGVLHIKLDPEAGGSIGYISESGKSYNVVNIYDKGRYIQQSYYAGKGLNRLSGGQHPRWSPWPWNPIQAGDAFDNKAVVLERFNNGKTMYVRTRPMLWDMNREYAECEFETWVTLKGTAIHVRNRLITHRTDSLWTAVVAKNQELPAVYPIADLNNLYTYEGDKPWTNDALTKIESNGPPWTHFETSEHWAACVNDLNWGLGVYNESCTRFAGGFAGSPGGGPTDASTGHISILKTETLDKDSVFEYEYHLILGNISTIRSYVYQVHSTFLQNWSQLSSA